MSDSLTMEVLMVEDCEEGEVFGAPSASAGETVEVSFTVGARLVASGFAVVPPEAEEE